MAKKQHKGKQKMTDEQVIKDLHACIDEYLVANDAKCKKCKWWTAQPYSLQGRCELYKSAPQENGIVQTVE